MFKERFVELCNENGVSPAKVCESIGLSNSAYSKWSDSSRPRNTTLLKIAQYFGVTSDYLLGRTNERTVPDEKLEGIDFALSGEIKALSENEKQDLLDYIRFKKQQKEGR